MVLTAGAGQLTANVASDFRFGEHEQERKQIQRDPERSRCRWALAFIALALISWLPIRLGYVGAAWAILPFLGLLALARRGDLIALWSSLGSTPEGTPRTGRGSTSSREGRHAWWRRPRAAWDEARLIVGLLILGWAAAAPWSLMIAGQTGWRWAVPIGLATFALIVMSEAAKRLIAARRARFAHVSSQSRRAGSVLGRRPAAKAVLCALMVAPWLTLGATGDLSIAEAATASLLQLPLAVCLGSRRVLALRAQFGWLVQQVWKHGFPTIVPLIAWLLGLISALEAVIGTALLVPLVINPEWNQGRFLVSRVFRNLFGLLAGYGERPARVMGASIITVVLFAFLFLHNGIVAEVPDGADLIPRYDPLKSGDLSRVIIQRPLFESWTKPTPVLSKAERAQDRKAFLLCLYSSCVTFTTLGYGDTQPLGSASRFCASVEAYTGAILAGLFLVTVFRRVLRS